MVPTSNSHGLHQGMSDPATRDKLISAAERLFAKEGMAVSMRRINEAAGQRNASAAHYHFGSKEALIDAILEKRMGATNQRRQNMLDEAEEANLSDDLRTMVQCLVLPLAETISGGSKRSNYVRFLAQLNRDPSVDLSNFVGRRYNKALNRVSELIENVLIHFPRIIIKMRLDLMVGEMIYAVADIDQNTPRSKGNKRNESIVLKVNNLVDCMTGALAAPVSEKTLELLEERKKPKKRKRAA